MDTVTPDGGRFASYVHERRAEVEPALQDVLRLGAHQLLAMRVPDHAAIDCSVDMAKEQGAKSGASARGGFVNAVLRKVAARFSICAKKDAASAWPMSER